MPKRDLTVIMLTWNRRWTINHVLYNLFRNDFPFKTVIIDNGSTDGTREYLLEHKDEIDELILNKKNVGCVALNDALRKVEGNYVSIQADDHLLGPNWIRIMYYAAKTIEANVKNLGYVSSLIYYALPRQWFKKLMTYEEWRRHPDVEIKYWRNRKSPAEATTITKTMRFKWLSKPEIQGVAKDVVYHVAKAVGNGGIITPIRTFKRLGLFRSYGLRGIYDGEFRGRCTDYSLSCGYTEAAGFIHLKENYIRAERVKQAYASVKMTPKKRVKYLRDRKENKESAKKGIPPPSVPKL